MTVVGSRDLALGFSACLVCMAAGSRDGNVWPIRAGRCSGRFVARGGRFPAATHPP